MENDISKQVFSGGKVKPRFDSWNFQYFSGTGQNLGRLAVAKVWKILHGFLAGFWEVLEQAESAKPPHLQHGLGFCFICCSLGTP